MAKKYINPPSNHWWSNPLNFWQYPSVSKTATGTNIRYTAAESCSFLTVLKSFRKGVLKSFRKVAGNSIQKHITLSDYWISRNFTLIAHVAYALCSGEVPVTLYSAYRLRGVQFMVVHEYILAVQMKSRNPNPLWNPKIYSEIRSPREIHWILKPCTQGHVVADPSCTPDSKWSTV